ncbi:S8 family peptidase [Kitasatospora sp. NPDC097605]|uniref:S8 family peptidase n=1 Tax=Kitasatospora sp. NPDC097605 TaxID=3157226 RepID=UPI003325AD2E
MTDSFDDGSEIPREFTTAYWTEHAALRPKRMGAVPSSPWLAVGSVITRPLQERMRQAESEPIGVLFELNRNYSKGLDQALELAMHFVGQNSASAVQQFGPYLAAALTKKDINEFARVDLDQIHKSDCPHTSTGQDPCGPVKGIWPNFEVHALIHRTAITTKSAAAQRTFGARGAGITWAVVDSGIDARHPHFDLHANANISDTSHWSYFGPGDSPLTDEAGHGTHVAGIIAGENSSVVASRSRVTGAESPDGFRLDAWQENIDSISGMAPECSLVSLKILDSNQSGDLIALTKALHHLRQIVSKGGPDLPVHGVNVSVGFPVNPQWYGTGQTPACREVDELVRLGLVVVAAAGNTGFGFAQSFRRDELFEAGFAQTINDPGNAAGAITVGSTSTNPYRTGVSYFSSKGPTGDGRLKPDLVAPGERVVSAASGRIREAAGGDHVLYAEDSGTSMAAPHVSGIAAAFLSTHREFIGRPEEVKRILLESAVDLGRARDFQGRGLVDAMSAIQSV